MENPTENSKKKILTVEKEKEKEKRGVLKIYADEDLTEDLPSIAAAVMAELKQEEDFYVDLTFLDKNEIKDLNQKERGVDAVTDVLSFPMLDGVRNKIIKRKDFPFDYDEDETAIFLGSIAICKERAAEQAIEYGHGERREITYLIVHALMHLFGYDHLTEEDKKEMREKEENVMNALGITR